MNLIKEIRISRFMGGDDIKWTLDQSAVSILVGINGRGKTTLLNLIEQTLSVQEPDYQYIAKFSKKIEIEFSQGIVTIKPNLAIREWHNVSKEFFQQLNIQLIHTLDIPIPKSENPIDAIRKLLGYEIRTTLDLELAAYVLRFREYKENIDNKVFSMLKLSSFQKGNLINYYDRIEALYAIINEFFEETEKTINREVSPFYFLPHNISFLELSTGEKQLLLLLLASFLHNTQENTLSIILLDEPEISLHLRWQQILLSKLVALNPRSQYIIATHSPSIYGKGYMVNKQDMETLFVSPESVFV